MILKRTGLLKTQKLHTSEFQVSGWMKYNTPVMQTWLTVLKNVFSITVCHGRHVWDIRLSLKHKGLFFNIHLDL